MVEWLEQLDYCAESHVCKFKALENSLCQPSNKGTFFELGKTKAAKGEGWAPSFISCAQDTVEL